MKFRFIWIGLLVLLVVIIIFGSVFQGGMRNKRKVEDFNAASASFEYRDKKPYGSFVAYKLLKQYLNGANHGTLHQIVKKPVAELFKTTFNQNALYCIIANNLFLSADDVDRLGNFIENGNEVFIAATDPDSLLAERLHFNYKAGIVDNGVFNKKLHTVQNFVNKNFGKDTSFAYKGIYNSGYFTAVDTAVTTVLGTNEEGKPNFIRIVHGNGDVYISLNPFACTNYFLLHGENHRSFRNMMGYIPDSKNIVYWDEYYKHQYSREGKDFDNWSVLMRYPSIRWTLILILCLMILFALFESKRQQRYVPAVEPVLNNSLDFVKTLGKLYFNHHDNKNLVHKMTTQFLDHVRNKYFIDTKYLDENFVNQLARKSNQPREEIQLLINMMHNLQLEFEVSDKQLEMYYQALYKFYQIA